MNPSRGEDEGSAVTFEIVREIGRCRELWLRFSPLESLFDWWDYRLVFHRAYQAEPHFLLVAKDGRETGVVPLERDHASGRLQLFGG